MAADPKDFDKNRSFYMETLENANFNKRKNQFSNLGTFLPQSQTL